MQNRQGEIIQLLNQTGPDPGIKLGLMNIKALLEAIGNPQDKIRATIHIAGTNGKGSTLAFLETLLRSIGLKVGKYTSPHLVTVTERFTLNGEQIAENELLRILLKLAENQAFANLTFFEKLTAAAFVFFEEAKVDVLLLETGLGGRLDATNTVRKPTLCLISSIGLDHQEYLGNTIQEIAFEKAGILKTDVPFFTTATKDALTVIEKQSNAIGAIKLNLKNFDLSQVNLGLKGKHQKENANLALNAFLYFQEILPNQAKKLSIKECLKIISEPINWPGRFQEVKKENKTIILDGAHNPAGAKTLRKNLDSLYSNQERVFLLGFLKTKDYKNILQIILKEGDSVILCLPDEESKSASLEEIQKYIKENFELKEIILEKNFEQAFIKFQNKFEANFIGIITGSLYLLGKALTVLKN